MKRFVKKFLALEAAGGLILMAVAVLAMAVANSPLSLQYQTLFALHSPTSLFINDGLMAVFFLLIGLEIKREMVEGELSSFHKALLPTAAAVGGVVLPAIIYAYFNAGTEAMRGWAIPAATDIAFSLGVLSLFGKRVPVSLKVFLMALAVIDDLAAVGIIAIFYTAQLNFVALAGAALLVGVLWGMNRTRHISLRWYLMAGFLLWGCVLMSGVHATVAGVLLGLLIPIQIGHYAIHKLHGVVAYGIVPVFAFANAGISLSGVGLESFNQPITLGIALGLFVGKQIGIFGTCVVLIKLGIAKLPAGANYAQLYAVSAIAGIGFTMSLFIAALAFNDATLQEYTKLGVVSGSLISMVFGAIVLLLSSNKNSNKRQFF